MEPNEALEQHEKNEEATRAAQEGHAFARSAAVLIAVLAAVLAIATGVGNNATTDTILKQAQAADTYNELQANSFKKHINNNDAVILRALAVGNPQKARLLRVASGLEHTATTKYARNETLLLPRAQELERERDKGETRHHTMQYAEGALQLAIVLSSVSIVVGIEALLWAGGVLGLLGLVLTLDGLFSIAKLPF
ncbi:MAG: hypothetical protein NVS2B16_07030 [Chloroflexota bacterium]